MLIDNQAATFAPDFAQRDFQLSPAVAAQAVEDIARKTLGMDAQQRRRTGQFAHRKNDGFLHHVPSGGAKTPVEAVDSKQAVFRGKVRLGCLRQPECGSGMH